jgi:hypothetical protein
MIILEAVFRVFPAKTLRKLTVHRNTASMKFRKKLGSCGLFGGLFDLADKINLVHLF